MIQFKWFIEHITNFSDEEGEKVNFFTWETKQQDGNLYCHQSEIVFSDTKSRSLVTAQPIPQSLSSSSFTAKVKNCSDKVKIKLGFNFLGKYINWRSDSVLENESGVLSNLEIFKEGDNIRCDLEVVRIDEDIYQYCKFTKNEKYVGGWVIGKGETIYPSVQFVPLTTMREKIVLEVKFGNKVSCNDHGKFLLTIICIGLLIISFEFLNSITTPAKV